jgi:hypothetical protein
MRVNTWGLCEENFSLLLTFISNINNIFKKCWTKKGEHYGGKTKYNVSYDRGINE